MKDAEEEEKEKLPGDGGEDFPVDLDNLKDLFFYLEAIAELGGYQCCYDSPEVFKKIPGRGKGLFLRDLAPVMLSRLAWMKAILVKDEKAEKVKAGLMAICVQEPEAFVLALCLHYLQKAKIIDHFTGGGTLKEIEAILLMCPHLKNPRHFLKHYRSIPDNPEAFIEFVSLERLEAVKNLLWEFPDAQSIARIDFLKKLGRG
ncbi:hypothetical protein [Rufibacter latericius]|uniref:Uncharacterized protein n=1 Tax=Rufibacter latericius TaxID=2487040 RepID=A0A3M9MTK8_9BACT|nr:hypothetical protein [Rufibacter latericius]RNI28829.1 hypothetical protein EFB08_09385 [Rufibacter latericius]